MARRFTVTSPAKDGGLYRAIKGYFETNYYNTSQAGIRGAGGQFTVGMLHLTNKKWPIPSGASYNETLFDCYNVSNGYRYVILNGTYRRGGLTCGGGGATSDNTGMDPGDTAFSSKHHQNVSGKLQLTTFVAGNSPYTGGALYINERKDQVLSSAFSSSGDGGPLYLGRGVSSGYETSDWILGFFWHDDPMTDDEIFILKKNIEIAKCIPDVDYVGGGVVPDHIWDVKQAMQIGAGNAPSTWKSIGATGGYDFSLTGSLDVVPVDAEFNVR